MPPFSPISGPALAGTRVLVIGLARSGLSAARLLLSAGARVTVADQRDATALGDIAREVVALGCTPVLGGHGEELSDGADLVVLSPGVPHTLPVCDRARRRGIPVMGEIELASRFVTAPIAAISGTNGKTTTTELTGRMLTESGRSVFVGGNIGTPLADFVLSGRAVDVVVLEISSFQLDTIERFRPAVAALLNITEDHLDRYPDMNAYARSKFRLFENQRPEDVAILNGADAFSNRLWPSIRSRRLFFNPPGENTPGAVVRDNVLVCRMETEEVTVDLSRSRLTGIHNRENIAAAALTALHAGATPDGVRRAVNDFDGLPHRLTFVADIDGVSYYDDSKATNVDAVVRALESFTAPIILLMGGRGKGYDFASLAPDIARRVKLLVTLGETGREIADTLGSSCRGGVRVVTDMAQAVAEARSAAVPGDVVLLSPACASFDQYRSYAQRGDHFARLVRGDGNGGSA